MNHSFRPACYYALKTDALFNAETLVSVYLIHFAKSHKAIILSSLRCTGDRGGTVVKVLRYKSEGRWFDSRWCHWNFSLT